MAKTVYSKFSFLFFFGLFDWQFIFTKKKKKLPISYFFFFSSFKQLLGWLMVEVGKKSHKLFDPNMGKQKKKRSFFLWIGWRRASLTLSACTRPSLNECCIIMSLKNNKKVSILICAPNTTSCMLNCITQSWIDLSAIPGDKSRHEM